MQLPFGLGCKNKIALKKIVLEKREDHGKRSKELGMLTKRLVSPITMLRIVISMRCAKSL